VKKRIPCKTPDCRGPAYLVSTERLFNQMCDYDCYCSLCGAGSTEFGAACWSMNTAFDSFYKWSDGPSSIIIMKETPL
jgi:hypothetical protein